MHNTKVYFRYLKKQKSCLLQMWIFTDPFYGSPVWPVTTVVT